MTNEGRWYAGGALVMLTLLLVLWLGAILLWIGLGLLLVILLIIGWHIWGVVHRRRIEARIARAEAVKVEAEAEQELAKADQQRAIAAGLWAQRNMIPATMVGMMLDSTADRERLATWAQPRKVIYHNTMEAPALPAPTPTQLPQAHAWEVIASEAGPNRFYLGAALDEQGRNRAIWVPLDGIITLVSIGPQGLGKTTLARSLTLQQVLLGGDVAICDWFNDIAAEMGRYFPHCYSEPEDCEQYIVSVLRPEMEARHAAYKAGKRDFPALLWLIDEWVMLKKDCPAMAEALIAAFTLWRKLGLRVVVSSVALDTRDLGVSKSAVSTLALFSGNENLARTWGLSGVKPQLDALYKSGRGYCLITSQHLQRQAELLAIPNVSAALFQAVMQHARPDLSNRTLASSADIPVLPPLPMKGEVLGTSGAGRKEQFSPVSLAPTEESPPQNVTFLSPRERENREKMAERARILELHALGYKPYVIARQLGRAGAYAETVKQIIAEAQAAQEADV